jgi:hypothetical protein
LYILDYDEDSFLPVGSSANLLTVLYKVLQTGQKKDALRVCSGTSYFVYCACDYQNADDDDKYPPKVNRLSDHSSLLKQHGDSPKQYYRANYDASDCSAMWKAEAFLLSFSAFIPTGSNSACL